VGGCDPATVALMIVGLFQQVDEGDTTMAEASSWLSAEPEQREEGVNNNNNNNNNEAAQLAA
jgi:hypothetical protein